MVFSHSCNAWFIFFTAFIFSLISFTPVFASSVQLKWDANTEPDLAGYKVYHNIASAPLAGTVPLDVSKKTKVTIGGLDPSKAYSFAITAYNTEGLESSFSNIVTVAEQTPPTVAVVKDLISPTVALTSPVYNATLNGKVTIIANASDNVAVSMVELYINGSLQYASNLSPYSYNWDTSRVYNGNYTLIAKAYDNAAHITQSSAVTVTVNNPLPGSTNLTVADALLALQIGSGKVVPTPEQMTRLDVAPVINGYPSPDGKIDTGDAIVILSKVVGKPVF